MPNFRIVLGFQFDDEVEYLIKADNSKTAVLAALMHYDMLDETRLHFIHISVPMDDDDPRLTVK